ncbi:cuticular protein 49Ad isoform 2-T2 [Cochliomyia hominivorax]
MNPLLTITILAVMSTSALSAITGNTDRIFHFRPGQYYDNKDRGRYNRNHDIYHPRRYYDNFYKKYNPDVEPQQARIVEQNIEAIKEDGSYGYMYETENGIHNEAHGSANILGNGDITQKVEGVYSFVTPEGIRVVIRYMADENGYRPIITFKTIASSS